VRHAGAARQTATAVTVKFGEGHDDAMQRKMPPYKLDKRRLTRTVTFNPAPDETSGNETFDPAPDEISWSETFDPAHDEISWSETFDPAPDDISGSDTATLDTKTPLEQHLEHESSSQHCSSLYVLNVVRKGTFTPKSGTRIPGEISEPNSTVDLPKALHEKKEYSRSKTE
jgi:hypothetical protein